MKNRTIEEIREFFKRDRFATERTEVRIDEARGPEEDGGLRVVCSMPASPAHRNAAGGIMGGAIFTLADFCFAIASNAWDDDPCTVAVGASIQFIGACKGERLIATIAMDHAGRTLSFAQCRVCDDTGRLLATVSFTGCRTKR